MASGDVTVGMDPSLRQAGRAAPGRAPLRYRPAEPGKDLPPRAAEGGRPAQPAAAAEEADGPGGVRDAVRRLNEYVQETQRDLRFSIDEETGRTVVRVVDSATQEVIRQIPPEEVLALARELAREERPALLAVRT